MQKTRSMVWTGSGSVEEAWKFNLLLETEKVCFVISRLLLLDQEFHSGSSVYLIIP